MSPPHPSEFLAELRGALGEAAVLEAGDGELARYESPARGVAGRTAAVLRPASTEQVRAVVDAARRHRVRLLPQGANSGLVGASTPPPEDGVVVVSTERLDEVVDIDPVDRTAVVDAGVRLSRLNEEAARHGLSFPIDVSSDPSIGGMVSTNTGGSRMLAHGDVRHRLLGLRAVLADAGCSVLDELTTLRKDNTGPTLGQLLVGAGGALGIVTRVALDLAPLPPDRACAWVTPTDDAALLALLTHLETHLGPFLSAFEVLSPAALAAGAALAEAAPPAPVAPASPRSAMVEVSGPDGVGDLLARELTSPALADAVADARAPDPAVAWRIRHSITDGLARRGTVVGVDVSVPRPLLPALVRRASTVVGATLPGAELADFGHWGDGGVHCNVVVPADLGADGAARDAVREAIMDVVAEMGGSYSGEHGIGPVNAARWLATTPVANRELLAAVAAHVDPLGILGHPGLPYRRSLAPHEPERSTSGTSEAASGSEK